MHESVIQHGPQIVPALTDSGNLHVQEILAALTFCAVLVALFQEKIKDWFNQSKLQLEINLNPPDCHQIDLTDQQTGQFISKCIYLRIRVTNTSAKTASNVEILASNLWKQKTNGDYKIVKTFLPMSLRWSHLHPRTETIPPQSFRFCDLGPVRPVNNRSVFKFDMIVQPNPVSGGVFPNIIDAGKYKFELLITGDNTKPKLTTWIFEFLDKWSNDEDKMLERIKIRKIG